MPGLRKLTLDDLWTFKMMGNIALSPDGRHVAFVMHSSDKTKNDRQSAIYLLHLDDQGHAVDEARQLTSGVKNDSYPAWAPDSRRLLFISDREEEKNQLWLIDTDGGEARKLTSMLNGVSEAAWSPDGQWIAFTAAAAAKDDDEALTGRKPLNADEKKKREEEERIREHTITTIWYRLDGRGIFERFSQLFVMPAPANGTSDPAAIRRLTSGDFDHTLPAWTPDSSEIGVLCNRAADRDRSFVNDLWAISRETGEARCLSNGTLEIGAYVWSPDGSQAVLVGAQDIRVEGSSNAYLHLVPRVGGTIEILTADIDNHATIAAFAGYGMPGPYIPQWSADGDRVYFLVTERGCINVYRLDVAQKKAAPLTSGDQLTFFLALLPGEQGLLLAQGRPVQLWELYLLPLSDSGTSEPTRLTHLYKHQVDEIALSEPERIHYRGANGDEIEGSIATLCTLFMISGTVTTIS
jgi:dipeptidyl aminopeptidase/acylaminoacyl peptidase